jgi:hypothetical protein
MKGLWLGELWLESDILEMIDTTTHSHWEDYIPQSSLSTCLDGSIIPDDLKTIVFNSDEETAISLKC